jgi:predicted transcriptional regulator YdeE
MILIEKGVIAGAKQLESFITRNLRWAFLLLCRCIMVHTTMTFTCSSRLSVVAVMQGFNSGVEALHILFLAAQSILKGGIIMGSKVVNFQVVPFTPARVIGKTVRVNVDAGLNDNTITDLWAQMARDGSMPALLALNPSGDTVGWMGDFTPGAPQYTYLAGVLVPPDTPVPEGYEARDLEACDMAVASIQQIDGDAGGDMMARASGHTSAAAKAHGYEYDPSHGLFEMEVYSQERFRGPVERGEAPTLDFYSPCRKAVTEPA